MGIDWGEMNKVAADEHKRARQRRDFVLKGANFNSLRRWVAMCIDGGFQASNERDFIYVLLNISDDCQNGEMLPDYEKKPADVLLEALSNKAFKWRGPRRRGHSTKKSGNYRTSLDLAGKMGLRLDLRRDILKAFGVPVPSLSDSESDIV
ncbi:hypothetical protein B0T16DRAFT_408597 [Cercophora newfieldiana]|uniref:Uncharacterized protein n=1 Tax=Cercophora newfieldiana TaxID=92897 RepID=A0AA39YBY1_9PEZI|nr:hypothetical protein B0T16DRAFT_408597 [Cercophora newfieldiana]